MNYRKKLFQNFSLWRYVGICTSKANIEILIIWRGSLKRMKNGMKNGVKNDTDNIFLFWFLDSKKKKEFLGGYRWHSSHNNHLSIIIFVGPWCITNPDDNDSEFLNSPLYSLSLFIITTIEIQKFWGISRF